MTKDPFPFITAVEPLPFHLLYTQPRRAALEDDWKKAHTRIPLSAALNALILASAFLSAFALFLVFSLTSDILASIGWAFLLFALSLLSGFYLPRRLAAKYASEVEGDLPMCLRAIALHLKIKLPFEQALAHAASGNYASSPLWRDALAAVESGESVPHALSTVAASVPSLPFSRAIHQLTVLYEEGGAPDALLSLADELTSQQLAALRLHASRAALVGLVFTASSSLLPAFFLIMAVAAGPLLDFHTDILTIWLFYCLALPLINLVVLGALLISAPTLSGSWKPARLREQTLLSWRAMNLPEPTSPRLLLWTLVFSLTGLILTAFVGLPSILLLLSISVGLLPLLLYSLLEGRILADTARMETELPNLLLSGSSSGRFSLEKMLEQSVRSPSAPLAQAAGESLRQLRAGANPVTVLHEWASHTPSVLVERTLGLLSIGYRTGGNLQKALRATAEDLLSSFSLMRERASMLSMQAYTLMAASGILVPAILAITLAFALQISQIHVGAAGAASPDAASSAASSIGADAASSVSSSASTAASSPLGLSVASPQLLAAAAGAARTYLLLNAILTAYILSMMQGARERFVPYAAMLALASQAVWMVLAPGI